MQSLLAQTANPEPPYEVNVGQPSDALTARAAAAGAFDSLFLGLGVVALIVGAVGVANLLEPSFAHSRPTEPKVRDSNPLERATCLAALSLQSSDVPCVHVRRAIVNGQLTAPKSRHGRRTIPISLELVDRLRELVAGRGETEPLLLGAQGAALRAGNLRYRVLIPAAHRAGVPWARFHDNRARRRNRGKQRPVAFSRAHRSMAGLNEREECARRVTARPLM